MKAIYQVRNQLKSDFRACISRPHIWPYLPIVAVLVIYNRIKYSKEEVYVIEQPIQEIITHIGEVTSSVLKFNFVTEYGEFDSFVLTRARDEDASYEMLKTKYKSRFLRGDFALVSYVSDAPVSFAFGAKGEVQVETVNTAVKLLPTVGAIYDVYTSKEHRGGGYYKMTIYQMLRKFQELGLDGLFFWVMKHNKLTIMVHDKIGIHMITKKMSYVSFLGFVFKRTKAIKMDIKDLL